MNDNLRARVLVVDDEPQVGRALRRLLWGDADVDIEHRALDALTRLFSGERFDLVLCDVRMPGVLGPDFVGCLRRFMPAAAEAVVLMSGDGVLPGAPATFVAKPFDIAALRALVRARVAERAES